jgi:hypothetical protein
MSIIFLTKKQGPICLIKFVLQSSINWKKFLGIQCETFHRESASLSVCNCLPTEEWAIKVHDTEVHIILKISRTGKEFFGVQCATVRAHPFLCLHLNCFPRKEWSKYFIHKPMDPFGDYYKVMQCATCRSQSASSRTVFYIPVWRRCAKQPLNSGVLVPTLAGFIVQRDRTHQFIRSFLTEPPVGKSSC